jgi:hypothetical protein
MWDTRVVEKVDKCVGEYTLAVSFKNIADNFAWAFVGVYDSNFGCDRRRLWDELVGICSWWNLLWRIRGDFNVTHFPSERSGEAHLCSSMTDFFNFIADQGLMDLPLASCSFTWSISHDPPVWSKIDNFLVSHDWEVRFPLVSQNRLSRLYSDHFPILIDCGDVSRGSRPFKFENMWLKVEGFMGLVKQWWDYYSFQGSSSFVLARKLKDLKLDLKKWNEEVFGNVRETRGSLLKIFNPSMLLKKVGP